MYYVHVIVYIIIYTLYVDFFYLFSFEQQQYFKMWEEYDDTEDSFCERDGQSRVGEERVRV